jgi:DNA-binding NarL/FixJ family response regulator
MSNRTRIVIADDLADLRVLLCALFEVDGRFDVVGEAANGREAVDLVAACRPDVAVLDLTMPKMTGAEAAGEIANVSPQTKVIVYSALVGEIDTDSAAPNVIDFVPKGAQPWVIIEAVARAAQSS